MTWYELYEIKFGKPLGQRIIDLWQEDIQATIHHLKDGEVKDALADIAEERRRHEAPDKFPPTSNDVISRIIRLRHRANKPLDFSPIQGCTLCINGWLSYIPAPDGSPIHPATLGRDVGTANVPCLCQAGERHMKRLGDKASGLTALRQRVVEVLRAPAEKPVVSPIEEPAPAPIPAPAIPPIDEPNPRQSDDPTEDEINAAFDDGAECPF